MAEFDIQTQQQLGTISFNYDELMEYVEEQVAPYRNMVVTEDSIKSGKEVAARLNNMAKDLNKRRIEAQKIWMGPFDEFKAHIDEAIKTLDEGRTEIKKQLDAFEEKRIAERQEELHKLYADNVKGYEEYVSYESVFKPQWINKSAKDQEIIYDISEAVAKVETDLSAIRALHSEIEEECIEAYKKTGNLAAAIQKNSDFLSAKKIVETTIREEIKKEAESKTEETVNSPADSEKKSPKDDFINQPEPAFWIGVFDEKALEDLRAYCEFNEIPYKKEVR